MGRIRLGEGSLRVQGRRREHVAGMPLGAVQAPQQPEPRVDLPFLGPLDLDTLRPPTDLPAVTPTWVDSCVAGGSAHCLGRRYPAGCAGVGRGRRGEAN